MTSSKLIPRRLLRLARAKKSAHARRRRRRRRCHRARLTARARVLHARLHHARALEINQSIHQSIDKSIDRIRINPPSASLSRLVATRRSSLRARCRASSRRRTSVVRARARRELSTSSRMDSTDRSPRLREQSSSLFAHTTMCRESSLQAGDTEMDGSVESL